ncbi:P-II family nitrogen regulator [Nesterenkonia lutea]|uniref:Nitrogen regulatory protein P-II 1 n=1 Tax=Nesterenkonia lutea TaxID=272919 RepID=A0ABR9JH58_9MICC|nr:P-II family nitrogen regulator [Nesterenkonia lutea]MBE1525135.1 nitrogen regulatory protein P-II 1 [Nesterenkonia lutea]
MKLITAVIQRNKLDPVTKALAERGVGGLTVMDVMGYGTQKGRKEVFRGKTYEAGFLPKTRIDVIVPAAEAEGVIDTIVAAAKTGSIGDGKVWATPLSGIVRVRTGEHGEDAI